MALPSGYRYGAQILRLLPLDSTSAAIGAATIAITDSGATATFFKEVDGSGERVVGWSAGAVASPSADGDLFVLVDLAYTSVYEMAPDSGTVTRSLVGKTCDIGADGLTINIDASVTDDVLIVDVDLTANTCFVTRAASKTTGVA